MKKSIWPLLVAGAIASGCSTDKGLRYDLSEGYQMLDIKHASYEEYQAEVEKILRENWTELAASEADYPKLGKPQVGDLVQKHKPTNKEPSNCDWRRGKHRTMLLIHGLYDSPYVMKDLEEYFRSRCFHTRSILLPGHGTRPASLLDFEYKAWVDALSNAVTQLRNEGHEDIYITGFSTGGALALKSVLDHQQVKGLFLFAPALKVPAWPARVLKFLSLGWVPFQKFEDKDLIKYESLTLDSVIEVGKLADEVRGRIENSKKTQFDIPILLVVAQNDYTIKAHTAIQLYEQGRFGDKSEMLIYAPLIVEEKCIRGERPGNSTATPKIPTYISSCFVYEQMGKKFMIADYSHMALTLKSTDDHFGLEGNYKYCLQYFSNDALEYQCKTTGDTIADICFGERKLSGSASYPQCQERGLIVRRLTSNPQFEKLTNYLDQFIARHIDNGILRVLPIGF